MRRYKWPPSPLPPICVINNECVPRLPLGVSATSDMNSGCRTVSHRLVMASSEGSSKSSTKSTFESFSILVSPGYFEAIPDANGVAGSAHQPGTQTNHTDAKIRNNPETRIVGMILQIVLPVQHLGLRSSCARSANGVNIREFKPKRSYE